MARMVGRVDVVIFVVVVVATVVVFVGVVAVAVANGGGFAVPGRGTHCHGCAADAVVP